MASAVLLEDNLERFRLHLRRRNLSERTVQSYCDWALRDLFRFGGEREMGEALLEDWQDSMVARGWKAKSRALAATAVRSYLRWMIRQHRAPAELLLWVDPVRTPRRLPRPLDDLVLERVRRCLLDYELGRSPVALRDRALFLVLLTTGLRISEALALPRRGWERLLITQKGDTERWFEAPPTAVAAVREYLASRSDALPWLWISQHGEPRQLSRHAVRRSWQRVARRCGVAYFNSHRIRHTSGTALYAAGMPELVVATHLGHADLSSIHGYVKVADRYRARRLRLMEKLATGEEMSLDEWQKVA